MSARSYTQGTTISIYIQGLLRRKKNSLFTKLMSQLAWRYRCTVPNHNISAKADLEEEGGWTVSNINNGKTCARLLLDRQHTKSKGFSIILVEQLFYQEYLA